MTENASSIIHVVDDDASLRTALSRLLTASGYHVALYESAAQFLDRGADGEPGCILLDVNMPGLDGLQLQGQLGRGNSRLPIVFITGHGDIAMSVRAIKAGAEDFLPKPVAKQELLDAVQRALRRYHEVHSRHTYQHAMQERVALLTLREREVFDLLIVGMLNKQIAHALGNTERTVKMHRHRVMEKMRVRSVAELVSIASQLGLMKDGDSGGNNGGD